MAQKNPFSKYRNFYEKKKDSATFDKNNIFMEKAGKKINNYELIQASRDGTEIYATIEKYGTLEKHTCDPNKVYGDISTINNLRDVYDKVNMTEQVWQELPLEIRKEFNSSKGEFLERGQAWADKKIKEAEALKQKENIVIPNEEIKGE